MANSRLQDTKKNIVRQIKRIPFWLSLLAVLMIIFDFGFDQTAGVQEALYWIYIVAIAAGTVSIPVRFISPKDRPSRTA